MDKIGNRSFSRYKGASLYRLGWTSLRKLIGVEHARPNVGPTVIVSILVIGLLALGIGYTQVWSGLNAYFLWNWLELLSVPGLVLVSIMLVVIWTVRRNEQQAINDLKITEWYARHARAIEAERSRETAFQTYLDRMTELLLEKKLRHSEPGSDVRNIARARTLTVLRGLDGAHKGILLRFLYESGLIIDEAIIELNGADLSGAELSRATLTRVDLRGANLSAANLSEADLSEANLSHCVLVVTNLSDVNLQNTNLSKANLTEAVVYGANLSGADLSEADLHGANLEESNLSEVNLREANLKGAVLIGTNLSQANLGHSILHKTNLHRAVLQGANLVEADLSWAELAWANLGGAELNGADMRNTNLAGANIIGASLRAVKSLKGATMPDGKKHL